MIFKSPFLQKIWDKFGQFIKFSVIGLSNSLIAVIVFNFYIFLIGKSWWFISTENAGYILGFVLSIINCYYWNIKYVFPSRGSKAKEISKFFLQYILTFFLGLWLMNLFCAAGIHESISHIMQMAVTSIINYFGSKFLVFRYSKEEKT